MYKATNLDTDKIQKALDEQLRFYQNKAYMEREKIEARLQGQTEALRAVEDMLSCSNYEKAKERL